MQYVGEFVQESSNVIVNDYTIITHIKSGIWHGFFKDSNAKCLIVGHQDHVQDKMIDDIKMIWTKIAIDFRFCETVGIYDEKYFRNDDMICQDVISMYSKWQYGQDFYQRDKATRQVDNVKNISNKDAWNEYIAELIINGGETVLTIPHGIVCDNSYDIASSEDDTTTSSTEYHIYASVVNNEIIAIKVEFS